MQTTGQFERGAFGAGAWLGGVLGRVAATEGAFGPLLRERMMLLRLTKYFGTRLDGLSGAAVRTLGGVCFGVLMLPAPAMAFNISSPGSNASVQGWVLRFGTLQGI